MRPYIALVFIILSLFLSGCANITSFNPAEAANTERSSESKLETLGLKKAPPSPVLEQTKAVMEPILERAKQIKPNFGFALPYGGGSVKEYVHLAVRRIGKNLYDAENGESIGSFDPRTKTAVVHYCKNGIPTSTQTTCWKLELQWQGSIIMLLNANVTSYFSKDLDQLTK